MTFQEMNPTIKFLTVTLLMFGLAFMYNPWTPLAVFIGTLILQILFSNVNWKRWALLMIPFLFTALGTLWTTLVFGKETSGEVMFTLLGNDVTAENVSLAATLSLRVLAFTGLSLLFTLTTEPKRFVYSLMQQGKLSPKIAYSVFVGFRFFPILKHELMQLYETHALRGVRLETRLDHIRHVPKVIIPLLAGSIRQAERIAFSMEARGFTGEPRATYEVVPITRSDFLLASLLLLLFGASVWIGI
ncbi:MULTISPECIES: energy-coupling factor transporter transmembrane component T family protein [Exiguobacterium]|uniref:energy-coupling factor transporter transmembrane component T family protein n=1 Tax=Exiguobacterium TaxID=33986 RepID=UPI000FE185EC|nr:MULTISPECIES: energy-coupling factor transporter transmembrane component T [Exiguobacterium]MCT4777523.1 energy-coupling factor transporter transmembrane protein EcfT [Exiguobacterium aquaticum]MCT4788632.1 energy-coupling factor transporter transmembrane protein EcfT [Exiguobacterium mexicanum]RHB52010.1 cobalt transporter [Exiguobacterium sp. AM39-5BH]